LIKSKNINLKKLILLIFSIVFLNCNFSKTQDPKLNQETIIIEQNQLGQINADTLLLKPNGDILYHHTGIGVKFTGHYNMIDDVIDVTVLDYEKQFDNKPKKIKTLVFSLKRTNESLELLEIQLENHVFDKLGPTAIFKMR